MMDELSSAEVDELHADLLALGDELRAFVDAGSEGLDRSTSTSLSAVSLASTRSSNRG